MECLGISDCNFVLAQVASSSRTYFEHRTSHRNQSEKAFCSLVKKATGVKADAEVRTVEQ